MGGLGADEEELLEVELLDLLDFILKHLIAIEFLDILELLLQLLNLLSLECNLVSHFFF